MPNRAAPRSTFTGTSEQRPTNFNAPLAVTRAAVLYVPALLVDEAVPLNEGFLRPVTLIVPEGSMLNPRFPAAVVAGNVEVSQVVTDTLLGALGAMAASQGTMNNLTFGDDSYQYYETIAGGAGAGPGHDGADAIQTHMTNSRLTDPEVLETRYPCCSNNSHPARIGWGGEWHGGDGTIRRLRFRQPLRAAILSNRRVVPPFGLNGGEAGQPGRNRVERADGSVQDLASTAGIAMGEGDVLVIETPAAAALGGGRADVGAGGDRRHRGRLPAAFQPAAGHHRVGACHRLRGGAGPVRIVATFGHAFNETRYVTAIYMVLPVIGLLERRGFRRGRGRWSAGFAARRRGGC